MFVVNRVSDGRIVSRNASKREARITAQAWADATGCAFSADGVEFAPQQAPASVRGVAIGSPAPTGDDDRQPHACMDCGGTFYSDRMGPVCPDCE